MSWKRKPSDSWQSFIFVPVNSRPTIELCRIAWLIACCFGFSMTVRAQSAFDCTCQRIYYDHVNGVFAEARINPGNNALQFPEMDSVSFTTPVAIGFRRTTGEVYVLESGTNLLHLYYADGGMTNLPSITGLPSDLDYKAGEISPDGNNFYVIGSRFGQDRALFIIDLLTGDYDVTEVGFSNIFDIEDIAFDPYADFLFMYDRRERHVLKLNLTNYSITGLWPIEDFREIQSLYFDAFGDLYGIGTTQFGVASGLFRINKENGEEMAWAAGPVAFIEDLTACPYTVKMRNQPSAENVFPCEEMTYTYTIANATGNTQSNLIFRTRLNPGFRLEGISHPTLGGNDTYDAGTGEIEISSFVIPPGIHSIEVRVFIEEDIDGGVYFSQGEIRGLPQTLGGNVQSDNPKTPGEGDRTPVTVTRLESDSLYLTRFICSGQSLELDGSIYGTAFSWSNGSAEPSIVVSEAGLYALRARTGCAELFVEFEVTVASCPFRLDMDHVPLPDSTFPCSEIIYQFVIDNSTGVEQRGISFTDSLPDGIFYLDVLKNPYGGILDESSLPGVIQISGMTIPVGIDTIHFLVEVTDIDPGKYPNQARLDNLPFELGTFRVSDDPRTTGFDSTDTHVLGVEADSLYLERVLCAGNTIELDASPYGTRFEWMGGETARAIEVDRIGTYEVKVFNGCEESWLFFEVVPGAPIDVWFDKETEAIRLGDSIRLEPLITNALDSLSLSWIGGPDSSLSCRNCIAPLARPLESTYYQVFTTNGVCSDSATIKVFVDLARNYFVPNVFTPNGDGKNDFFGIFSPDFGVLENLEIYDRRGNLVFASSQAILNEPETGWDGRFAGQPALTGVYFYNFRIRFLDGFVRNYTGNVTLLR